MVLKLDIATIILAIILGNLFSVILSFSYMVRHKRDTTLYTFLLARLFDTAAWILLGLQASFDGIDCILIGNTLLILANTLQIISFLKIKSHYNPLIKRVYLFAFMFSTTLFYIFTKLYHANDGIRITIISSAMGIMWCYPVYVLLKDENSSPLQRVIAIVFGGELLLLFMRAYIGIKDNDSISLMSNNLYNILFFVGLYLVMLMGNIGYILMAKENTDRELAKAAEFDELTEIFNRREFLRRARNMISLYERKKEPLSFFMIDLDHFKEINDVYGHTSGDLVLKNFAAILRANLGEHDLFGRFGGEEFTVLLPNTDEKVAMEIANHLKDLAENSTIIADKHQTIKYTISIGTITVIPNENTSVDTLYKLSDDALYFAKMNGRNRVEPFPKDV